MMIRSGSPSGDRCRRSIGVLYAEQMVAVVAAVEAVVAAVRFVRRI